VESAIALSEALKPHIGAGWMEDIIDWWVDGCSGAPSKAVADSTDVLILTGEDMFGFDQFKNFSDIGAFNLMHPEPNTAGGINQTLLAALYAHTKGIRTVFHNSSGPIAMTAYAHIAAAIPDFYALEFNKFTNSYRDFNTWHDDLVDGIDKPMIQNGFMNVPEGPGLGVVPNDTAFIAHGAGTWTKVV
jgi:L-alanine-DL-glutamate epimerase-like enolase superfamily enzyme